MSAIRRSKSSSDSSSRRGLGRGRGAAAKPTMAVAAVVLAVGAATAGCGSNANTAGSGASSSSTSASASGSASYNAELCSDLGTLGNDLNSLKELKGGDVTLDQIKAIDSSVKSALDQATNDSSGVDSAKLAAINAAYSVFTDALNALPSSTNASQAYQNMQPQIDALSTAFDAAKAGANCPQLPA
jgi:hypothetical protein